MQFTAERKINRRHQPTRGRRQRSILGMFAAQLRRRLQKRDALSDVLLLHGFFKQLLYALQLILSLRRRRTKCAEQQANPKTYPEGSVIPQRAVEPDSQKSLLVEFRFVMRLRLSGGEFFTE
jgi:hypothetical protein